MKISTLQLLSELKTTTQQNIQYVESLLEKSGQELNHRISEQSWSALECIEHLNLYGDFYIPEITRRLGSADCTPRSTFSPGILGNYFVNSMLPKGKSNKMKTFKIMDPIYSELDSSVLSRFIDQQKTLLDLLEKCGGIDLGKIKTSISISGLIKLKLGDTLRFVVYHHVRHIEQAKIILATAGYSADKGA